MIDPLFNTTLARELAEIIYSALQEKGTLGFYDILDIMESLSPEYGLRRVQGGAIQIVREKDDVEQVRDEKGRSYLRLRR